MSRDWMDDADCRGALTFTEWPLSQQMALCHGCPVRADCLAYGLEVPVYSTADAVPYGGFSPEAFARFCSGKSARRFRDEAVHRYLSATIQAALFGVPAA